MVVLIIRELKHPPASSYGDGLSQWCEVKGSPSRPWHDRPEPFGRSVMLLAVIRWRYEWLWREGGAGGRGRLWTAA